MIRNKAISSTFRLLIILSLLLTNSPLSFGCMDPGEKIIFVHSMHPDFPLDKFAKGELGILQPDYARSYLIVAYRYLNGLRIEKNSVKPLTSIWHDRMGFQDTEKESKENKAIEEWLKVRKKIPGVGEHPVINSEYAEWGNTSYSAMDNCLPEAFITAARTLSDRSRKWGKSNTIVKDWVKTQDQVFAGCSGTMNIPIALPSSAPYLARADRTYQIAAAHFYDRNYNESAKLFNEISSDKNSPWKAAASLLVARSMFRKATLSDIPDKESLEIGQTHLMKVLNEHGLSQVHASARRLIGFARYKLEPDKRVRELASALSSKNIGINLDQFIIDYTRLIDRYETIDEEWDSNTYKYTRTRTVNSSSIVKQDDLTDWLFTFQANDKVSLDHSIDRWKETSSLPWLLAAITKINAKDQYSRSIIATASRLKPGSPAYYHANYHLLRLKIEAGHKKAARIKIDKILAIKSSMPVSARNHFLHLRMKLAGNAWEFFKYSQRKTSAVTYDNESQEIPIQTSINSFEPRNYAKLVPYIHGRTGFDIDSLEIINGVLPLSILSTAAQDKRLPIHIRRQLCIAAFTRAMLLNNDLAIKSLAPALLRLKPEMKTQLKSVIKANNSINRQNAALFTTLKFPGMRPNVDYGMERIEPHKQINNYRNNWWCSFDGTSTLERETPPTIKPEIEIPAFLSKKHKKALTREQSILGKQLAGPNELCKRTVEWAKRNPKDPRIAEALHLAVKSVRYGCRDENTTRYSKAAFQTLHKLFPNSVWAKKTTFYY